MARRNRPAVESDTSAFDFYSPSSPSRPPVVAIYARREDNPDKILITSWASWKGAAAFLEALIQDQEGEPKWLKHKGGRWTQLTWPSGLIVTTRNDATLEKLVETETTWELPEPYLGQIRQFLGNAVPVAAEHERRPRERGEKTERAPRTPREKTPTKSSNRPAGLVHIAELVPDVSPAHARAALRTLKWTKPEYGWWFEPSRAAEVSKAIKGALR